MILVRSPLRISFIGGGSDVPSHYEQHGGATLSIAIDKYIYITSKPSSNLFPNKYRIVYSKIEEVSSSDDIKHPIIKTVLDHHPQERLDLDVMSDVPAGTGLGSSSAFTVGLYKALTGSWYDKHELAQAACELEIDILKEPIGKQDQYAAAFGGLNYIEYSKERVKVNPLALPRYVMRGLRDRMTLIYVGGSRSASKLLKEQFTADNSMVLGEMAFWARQAANNLKRGELDSLGSTIRKGWELKKKLSPNVSTEYVDELIKLALENGATGGKLLGAGGAGFVLLYHRGDYTRLSKGLERLNPHYIDFNFDMEGCKVLYDSGDYF